MGHGIEKTDAMLYTGKRPWHGLGTEIDHVFTSKEALAAGGLTFKVAKYSLKSVLPIITPGTPERQIEVPDYYATVRTDINSALGVVGSQYKIVQNEEAFGFFDAVVGSNEAMYHTVGSINGGKRIWLLAKLPSFMRIDGTDDVIEKFLLFSNSHDGSSAVKMFFTPIRVVCQNTLNWALGSRTKANTFTLRHTESINDKLKEARKILQITNNYYDDFNEVINAMARKQVTKAEVDTFVAKLFPIPKDTNVNTTKLMNNRDKLYELFDNGMGNDMPGIRGTAWALVNAAAEFADYERTVRASRGRSNADARLDSIWFGSGANFKQEAFDAVKELLNA